MDCITNRFVEWFKYIAYNIQMMVGIWVELLLEEEQNVEESS